MIPKFIKNSTDLQTKHRAVCDGFLAQALQKTEKSEPYIEEASKFYTDKAHDTVEATLSEMESRWYNSKIMMTLADKMLDDYNKGKCVLNQIEQSSMEINEGNEQLISM